jgi:hypothetical protein
MPRSYKYLSSLLKFALSTGIIIAVFHNSKVFKVLESRKLAYRQERGKINNNQNGRGKRGVG